MKCFFFLIALIGVATPIFADVDFTELVELEHRRTPLSWNNDPLYRNITPTQTNTKNTVKKVDIFVISSMLSGIDCNSLYVREWAGTEEIPQREEQEVLAQADEPIPPPAPTVLPGAPSATISPQESLMAHFTEPEDKETPFSENISVASQADPIAFEELAKTSEAPCPCLNNRGICKNLSLLAGFGYRRDNIWWTNKHIHQNLGLDKAKAKDRLENVDIFLFTTSFRGTFCDCLYVRGTVDYGWIIDGDEKQKDLFEVHKTVKTKNGKQPELLSVEFIERSHLKGDTVADLSIAVGYPITFRKCCCDCCCCCDCPCFTIAPVAGFSYNTMQLLSDPPDIFEKTAEIPLGPPYYEGVEIGKSVRRHGHHLAKPLKHPKRRKKTNINSWSPFLGVDFAYKMKCVELFGELEFHVGRIHWRCSNRIPTIDLWHALHEVVEFKYRQSKTVAGVKFKTGIRGPLSHCWFYQADVSYQDYSTFKHNQIDWQSFEINLQIGRIF